MMHTHVTKRAKACQIKRGYERHLNARGPSMAVHLDLSTHIKVDANDVARTGRDSFLYLVG